MIPYKTRMEYVTAIREAGTDLDKLKRIVGLIYDKGHDQGSKKSYEDGGANRGGL